MRLKILSFWLAYFVLVATISVVGTAVYKYVESEEEISTSSNIKLAPPELQKVFYKLKRASGENDTKLYIEYGRTDINARAKFSGAVVLTEGMIVWTSSHPQELYHVMAHEIAHVRLGHVSWLNAWCNYKNENNRTCEKEADLEALKYMDRAGLDRCAAGRYWARFIRTFGNGGGGTHPTHKERYEYLRCRD